MRSTKTEFYFAIILLVTSLLALFAGLWLATGWSVSVVVMGANLLLYALTLYLFRRTKKSFADPNPQVSIRAIMSGFMIKFFLLAVAALVYIFVMRKEVSIPALLCSATLYLLYTTVEIRALLLLLKSADHA